MLTKGNFPVLRLCSGCRRCQQPVKTDMGKALYWDSVRLTLQALQNNKVENKENAEAVNRALQIDEL